MLTRRRATHAALAIVLIVALGLRLYDVGFGLPSLYDPDEPIFMVLALKLLRGHTLNPGWFGHPGTTTIYLLALIDIAVFGIGNLTGHFTSVKGFAAAAYADPSLLFLPARVSMVLFGVACVWLTYLLGRRLFGRTTALIGAGLLAINSLHILWSQVIRTDVMGSVFMLGCIIFSVSAAKEGRLKSYLLAGACIGLAAATKWPLAIAAIALIGAAASRMLANPRERRIEIVRLALAFCCSIGALFLASPYIFLDWGTVLANVTGEMSPRHLGQTGGSFLDNLRWYLILQTGSAMGLVGLVLGLAGSLVAAVRYPVARWTIVPTAAAFLALICSQTLIWSRWLVPEMPLLCLFSAVAITAIGERLARKLAPTGKTVTIGILALIAAFPSIASTKDKITERANDTRSMAADWATSHVPRGSTVLLEHLELRLRPQPWHFLFPVGEAGCVDAIKAIQGGMSYEKLRRLRRSSPIVDIGNVDPRKLDTCHADYAIVTYYDQYLRERKEFPQEVQNYERLFSGGRTIALFRPIEGEAGGPVVRIVALVQQSKMH